MSVLDAVPRSSRRRAHATVDQVDPLRLLPTLVAGVLALVYVVVSPPSLDLAAHLFRARLFAAEGFGLWDNWWYAGHHTPGYSVLFPPVAAVLGPQLAAAIAAVATAATFEALVHHHFGRDAWLGALWFGAATAVNLYTGRLTFAFGLAPAVGVALALERRRPVSASGLAAVTALASPVAALFAALAGAAAAVAAYLPGCRVRPALAGVAACVAALAPLLILATVFPEGGTEPFAFLSLAPIPLLCLGVALAFPRRERAIRTGAVLYALGCLVAYLLATPVGSNAARLGPLLGGPLAAIALWPARRRLLLLAAAPLLYLQVQAPVRDVSAATGDPSATPAYWRPLLGFLDRQAGPPFRVEIPFTRFHRESYEVAPRFPLARGWERQLDIEDNAIFYTRGLTAAGYDAWLHRLGVRFVALSDAPLDYSARTEQALVQRGLPYLRPVLRTAHWRVYAVRNATPIVSGAATLEAYGPNSLTLRSAHPGTALVRVRFTPYWALSGAAGCVAPAGGFTRVSFRQAGRARLIIRFSEARIGARSPRCTSAVRARR